jgi:hypothetical protein
MAGLDRYRFRLERLTRQFEDATGIIWIPQRDGSVSKFTPQDAQAALPNGIAQIVEGAEPDRLNLAAHNAPDRSDRSFFGIHTVTGEIEELSEQEAKSEHE